MNEITDDPCIEIRWHLSDILSHAKALDLIISREQGLKILHDLKNYHDCEYGITWETIKMYIEEATE